MERYHFKTNFKAKNGNRYRKDWLYFYDVNMQSAIDEGIAITEFQAEEEAKEAQIAAEQAISIAAARLAKRLADEEKIRLAQTIAEEAAQEALARQAAEAVRAAEQFEAQKQEEATSNTQENVEVVDA